MAILSQRHQEEVRELAYFIQSTEGCGEELESVCAQLCVCDNSDELFRLVDIAYNTDTDADIYEIDSHLNDIEQIAYYYQD